MGKIEDLKLRDGGDDEEGERGDRAPSPDARAQELLDTIEEMLGDGRWDFAEDTLKGIYDTVRNRTGRITLGQRRAVENIYNSKLTYEDPIRWRYV